MYIPLKPLGPALHLTGDWEIEAVSVDDLVGMTNGEGKLRRICSTTAVTSRISLPPSHDSQESPARLSSIPHLKEGPRAATGDTALTTYRFAVEILCWDKEGAAVMANVDIFFEEYSKEVGAFDELVTRFRNSFSVEDATNKQQLIVEIESKYKRIGEVKKSFGLEIRLIKDRAQKVEYDSKGKMVDERASKLNTEFRSLKLQQGKNELMANTPNYGKPGQSQAELLAGKNNDEVLDMANKVQDKSFESLARTRNLVETSRAVGQDAIDEMRRQRDQIKDIEGEVDAIDTHLKRAERLVMEFSRRIATDRIIQCFSFLNIVVLLGLILYVVISGKSLSK